MSLAPHVRYHNPYGGHPILRRDPREAYQAVLDFLEKWTDAKPRWRGGKISVWPTGGKFLPDNWDDTSAKSELTRKLGRGKAGITLTNFTTGESEPPIEDWEVPARLHDWAIDFTLSQPKARRSYPHPVSYSVDSDFRMRTPDGKILPGQASKSGRGWKIRSTLGLTISTGNTSAFFNLVFPFPQPNAAFVKYLKAIRPSLPFRLAKGNFKLYVPNKVGTDYRVARINKTLLTTV